MITSTCEIFQAMKLRRNHRSIRKIIVKKRKKCFDNPTRILRKIYKNNIYIHEETIQPAPVKQSL